MLIEKGKTFSVNDIIVMKLITGEEIITKVTADDGNVISIKSPLTLLLVGQQGGHGAVAMTPFMLGINESDVLDINRSMIITARKPRQDAVNMYMQHTSGLTVASSMPDLKM